MKEFFNILKYLTWEKKPWNKLSETEKDAINPFMLNRYISMCPDYIELANIIQQIPYTEKEKIYKVYLDLLPKRNVYLKYLKPSTKSTSNDLSEKLALYFESSKREVKDYLDVLSKDEVKEILEALGTDSKEIKKLIK
jgi:hypothetical protein